MCDNQTVFNVTRVEDGWKAPLPVSVLDTIYNHYVQVCHLEDEDKIRGCTSAGHRITVQGLTATLPSDDPIVEQELIKIWTAIVDEELTQEFLIEGEYAWRLAVPCVQMIVMLLLTTQNQRCVCINIRDPVLKKESLGPDQKLRLARRTYWLQHNMDKKLSCKDIETFEREIFDLPPFHVPTP